MVSAWDGPRGDWVGKSSRHSVLGGENEEHNQNDADPGEMRRRRRQLTTGVLLKQEKGKRRREGSGRHVEGFLLNQMNWGGSTMNV